MNRLLSSFLFLYFPAPLTSAFYLSDSGSHPRSLPSLHVASFLLLWPMSLGEGCGVWQFRV